jgi:molybdopterin-guanine dinucleotide biosynthesis protein
MQRQPPFVLSVVGLKKSGKTTVAASLIARLSSRGFAVAALKRSHLPELTLDSRGTDSSRLLEAGASFVAVRSRSQTLTVERHTASNPAAGDLLDLVPPNVDLVVGEGRFPSAGKAAAASAGSSPTATPRAPAPGTAARARAIVCLRRFEELEETLRVRGVRPEEVLAVSGVAAAGVTAGAGEASRAQAARGAGQATRTRKADDDEAAPAGGTAGGEAAPPKRTDYPVFDVQDPRFAEALCELVLATAGLASPGPHPPSGA